MTEPAPITPEQWRRDREAHAAEVSLLVTERPKRRFNHKCNNPKGPVGQRIDIDGAVYPNQRAAAAALGISHPSLRRYLMGQRMGGHVRRIIGERRVEVVT